MTKEKMIKIIDDLIKDELEAIEKYNDAIDKLSDSPRIVEDLGIIYQEETRHIRMLNQMKSAIENHDRVAMEASRLYGLEREMDDGIRIDSEEE